MVVKIVRTTTTDGLRLSLERIRKNRVKRKRTGLTEFFGKLPAIGDGLEFQKAARDEWE